MKRKYQFVGRDDDCYLWVSVLPIPGDSRHEEIRCNVNWFGNQFRSKGEMISDD